MLNEIKNGYFGLKEYLVDSMTHEQFLSFNPSDRYFFGAYVLGRWPYEYTDSWTSVIRRENPKKIGGKIAFLSSKFSEIFASSQTAYQCVIPFNLIDQDNIFLIQTQPLQAKHRSYATNNAGRYFELTRPDQLIDLINQFKVDRVVDLTGNGWPFLRALRESSVIKISLFGTFGIEPGLYDFHVLSNDITLEVGSTVLSSMSSCGEIIKTDESFLVPYLHGDPELLNGGYRKVLTFGIFSRPSKWSEECLRAWAAIARSAPDYQIVISFIGITHEICRYIANAFGRHDVPVSRLTFLGWTNRASHRAKLGTVDVYLDSFPQGGGLQLLEAISVGLPVVVGGPRSIFNAAPFIMERIGCSDFSAKSTSEYVSIGFSLVEKFKQGEHYWGSFRRELLQRYRDNLVTSGLVGNESFKRDYCRKLLFTSI